MIGLVDCRYVWILIESTGRKKPRYIVKYKENGTEKFWRPVPLLQALPVIITPTAALASFKTAADTNLQKKKHQKGDYSQEHKLPSWEQEQTKIL